MLALPTTHSIFVLSQIPNMLTLARIAACPVLVILLNEQNYMLALLLCVVAGITDGLDGWIAKKFDYVSSLGTVLDPIADKLLIASAYVMLAILGDLPFWLLVVVMFRDLVIVVGFLVIVLMGEDITMRPTYSSKINTFLQITLMIAVLIFKATNLDVLIIVDTLIFGVLLTTVVSGIQYVWLWGIRHELDVNIKRK